MPADSTVRPLPGSTLYLKGELIASENLNLEGIIEGAVTLEGYSLTTGANARVDGAVTAKTVTVLGRLKGHITADIVEIAETATVEASVIARSFALDEGALFNGAVNTERARAAGEIARRRLAGKGTNVPNSGTAVSTRESAAADATAPR